MKSKQISFRVRPGRDDQIIEWLDSLPQDEKGVFIRQALREWLSGELANRDVRVEEASIDVSEDEIFSKLEKIGG